MKEARWMLEKAQQAAKRVVVATGVAALLAVGGAVVAGAFTYALSIAVGAGASEDDAEQPRER